jgi:hypothetical protein
LDVWFEFAKGDHESGAEHIAAGFPGHQVDHHLCDGGGSAVQQTDKSFLVLFFKKELLS